MRTLLSLSLTFLVLGCGSDDRPPAPRGSQARVQPTPPQPTPAERRAGDQFRPPAPDRRPGVSPNDLRPMQIVEQRSQERPEQERDFARELQAAAGSPMGCGELGGLTGEIRIPLTASVSVQGVVTRASVGGSIPAETRECMQRKIEAHRFAPIPEGPKTITATLVVTGTPGETMTEEVTMMSGFALQAGQRAAQGPSGTGISATGGTGISMGTYDSVMSTGVTIMGPGGSMIAGPGGRSITGMY